MSLPHPFLRPPNRRTHGFVVTTEDPVAPVGAFAVAGWLETLGADGVAAVEPGPDGDFRFTAAGSTCHLKVGPHPAVSGGDGRAVLTVTVPHDDPGAFDHLRSSLLDSTVSVSLYDMKLGHPVPLDPSLEVLGVTDVDPALTRTLRRFDLTPVYLAKRVLYAYDGRGVVYAVNPGLLSWVHEKALKTDDKIDELSYEVAPSLRHFGRWYDRGLIPKTFFPYYGSPLRIVDHSGFDYTTIRRKVFIRPLLYELTDTAHDDEPLTRMMTAVTAGESFETRLTEIVSDLYGVADDFFRAVIDPMLEYDRDRHGTITPRLVVRIYVKEFTDPDRALCEKQTGWSPLMPYGPDEDGRRRRRRRR